MIIRLSKEIWLVSLFSILSYLLYSLAFPLTPGRDFGTYFEYFYNILNSRPSHFMLMAYRTPGAPLFYGILHSLGGSLLVEVGIGILYVAMNIYVYKFLKEWSKIIAWIVLLLIFSNLQLQILLHSVGSDNLFALAFTLWFCYMGHVFQNFKIKKFGLLALFTFVLVMIRPSSQVLGVISLLPLIIKTKVPKFQSIVIFLLIFVGLILIFSVYHQIRYQDFSVSRGSKAFIPMYRLFTLDKLVRPENGPHSKQLAEVVQLDLLVHDPYKSYGITIDEFFQSGDPRMMNDLVSLSDRYFAWDSNYNMLFDVSKETIKKYPLAYINGVIRTFTIVFQIPGQLYFEAPQPEQINYLELKADKYNEYSLKKLNIPSEDSLIPGSYSYWLASKPNNYVPSEQDLASEKVGKLYESYPSRSPVNEIKNLLVYTHKVYRYLPIYYFMILAIVGLLITGKKNDYLMLAGFLSALMILFFTYISFEAVMAYRISFDPVIIMAGTVGGWNILNKIISYGKKNT